MKNETIKELSRHDPSPNGKYRKWLEREVNKGYKIQDLGPTLEFFYKNPKKFDVKDIYKWDGKQLEDHIKEKKLISNSANKRKIKATAKTLYQDERWQLLAITTKEAAEYYGVGTKWCITMDDSDYFETYCDDNVVFFYLIDKKAKAQAKWSKVCIVCERDSKNTVKRVEYFAADDSSYTFSRLPKDIKALLKKNVKCN